MEAAAGIYTRIIFPDSATSFDTHLSDLQKAMLDATPDCIKVVSVDGTLLTMNRAGCLALNVPENCGFGMAWLSLLPEDVHPVGREALRKAAAGQNARFPGKSVSPAGVTYWDNLLTPVIDKSGKVLSILCVSRDVTEKTLLEQQLAEVASREKLLSREMQHRIKNLFSVVSGLTLIAKKEAGSDSTPEVVVNILRAKLCALARASDAAFTENISDNTQTSELGNVVRSVLEPYGTRCKALGSATHIKRESVTVLALFLHEFATNSMKYGALSSDDGNIAVRWARRRQALDLSWVETGGPALADSPQSRGFGSEMIERLVRSAGGTIERTWRPDGLVADLHLPNAVHG